MTEEKKRKIAKVALVAGSAAQSYEVRSAATALMLAALLIVPGSLLVAAGIWYWRWAGKKERS